MSAFIQELFQTAIYKRNQGRITRQVTFAAFALCLAIGFMRLSQSMTKVDPVVAATRAEATYVGLDGAARNEARLLVAGKAGEVEVEVAKGEKLQAIADAVNLKKLDVAATVSEKKSELILASNVVGGEGLLKVKVVSGDFPLRGLNADGTVAGRNAVNLGLRYAVPGLLLALGLWIAYRLVNMATFADFLIAVEAEVNKVSWPTRHELIRASIVVLVLIIFLAVILLVFDFIWRTTFHFFGIV